jgi:hypothetical protein
VAELHDIRPRRRTPEVRDAELWSEWVAVVGTEFTGPAAHPELDDERITELARRRDLIRERTLAAIREKHPEIKAGEGNDG